MISEILPKHVNLRMQEKFSILVKHNLVLGDGFYMP